MAMFSTSYTHDKGPSVWCAMSYHYYIILYVYAPNWIICGQTQYSQWFLIIKLRSDDSNFKIFFYFCLI
jgi:hypothetical protein